MQVNMLEAKTRLSELVKLAQMGEDIVIANRGEPVARLAPVRARNKPRTGAREGIAAWLSRHPLPGHARRPADAIDAAIADERSAWD